MIAALAEILRQPARRSVSGAPLGAFVEDRTDKVEAGPRGEQGGDARGIVGRRYLDEIDAHHVEPLGDLAQDVLALVIGEAAMADGGGSWRDGRIEAVDVDRDIDALAVRNVRERGDGALCPHLAQRDDVSAVGLGRFPVLAADGSPVMWPKRGYALHMCHFGSASHWAPMTP